MCPREIKYRCHVSKQGCTLPTLHASHPRRWALRWCRMETRNDRHLASSDCSYPGRSTPKRLRMRKHTKTAEMHIKGKTSESPDFPCVKSAKFLYLKCLILFVAAFVQLLNHVSFAAPWTMPGSSVHGISQARIQQWVTTSFSRGYSQPRDRTHISYIDRRILYC